jgi:hypothetical protein
MFFLGSSDSHRFGLRLGSLSLLLFANSIRRGPQILCSNLRSLCNRNRACNLGVCRTHNSTCLCRKVSLHRQYLSRIDANIDVLLYMILHVVLDKLPIRNLQLITRSWRDVAAILRRLDSRPIHRDHLNFVEPTPLTSK